MFKVVNFFRKIFWAFLFFILKIQVSFAQKSPGSGKSSISTGGDDAVELHNPLGGRTLSDIVNGIIGYMIKVSVPIVTIMFLFGGFQMLTAGDNENRFKQGKKTITYAAIGALVILVSSGVIYVLADILGIDKSKVEQSLP